MGKALQNISPTGRGQLVKMLIALEPHRWAPRGLGGLRRISIFFRDLGSTVNYFRGSGEQAHSFGDLGSPAKKQKKKKKKKKN